MRVRPVVDQPLFDTESFPLAEGNINGPSLISVPGWLKNPLAKYYLYFAHHEGTSIRLATADKLQGPWHFYQPGTLHLSESGFVQSPPRRDEMNEEVLRQIDLGIDGDYAHIASPDVHVDEQQQQVLLYFHGRLADGSQKTRLAVSHDGIHFETQPELLGISYFRVFRLGDWFYALALGGLLYRSRDGRTAFEEGGRVTNEAFRHCAVYVSGDVVRVFWSRAGDCPERILMSTLDTRDDWLGWSLQDTCLVRAPEKAWEGADQPLLASRFGGVMTRVRQLRDPAIFEQDGRVWLLYSVAGEQGIALAEIDFSCD